MTIGELPPLLRKRRVAPTYAACKAALLGGMEAEAQNLLEQIIADEFAKLRVLAAHYKVASQDRELLARALVNTYVKRRGRRSQRPRSWTDAELFGLFGINAAEEGEPHCWVSLCLAIARRHIPAFQDGAARGRPKRLRLTKKPRPRGRPSAVRSTTPAQRLEMLEREKELIRRERDLPPDANVSDKEALMRWTLPFAELLGSPTPARSVRRQLKWQQAMIARDRKATATPTRKSREKMRR